MTPTMMTPLVQPLTPRLREQRREILTRAVEGARRMYDRADDHDARCRERGGPYQREEPDARRQLVRAVRELNEVEPDLVPDDLLPLVRSDYAEVTARPVPPPYVHPACAPNAETMARFQATVQRRWTELSDLRRNPQRGQAELRRDCKRLLRHAVRQLAEYDPAAVPVPLRPLIEDADASVPLIDLDD